MDPPLHLWLLAFPFFLAPIQRIIPHPSLHVGVSHDGRESWITGCGRGHSFLGNVLAGRYVESLRERRHDEVLWH